MRHKMTYNTQNEKCIFVIKFLHLVIRESLQVRKSGQDLMRSRLQIQEDRSPLVYILYLFSQVAALPVVPHMVTFKQAASHYLYASMRCYLICNKRTRTQHADIVKG